MAARRSLAGQMFAKAKRRMRQGDTTAWARRLRSRPSFLAVGAAPRVDWCPAGALFIALNFRGTPRFRDWSALRWWHRRLIRHKLSVCTGFPYPLPEP